MRLLHGTNRSALREQCLREVCDLMTVLPDRRVILLVPEQTKMDMERDYSSMTGHSGLMMAEVLSFRRLAWRLLGEVGRLPDLAIDPIGQTMLVYRILKQNQPELHSFGHLADRPGFITQITAALGDLKRYQIGAEQLLAAGIATDDKTLQNKTHDLGILMQEYGKILHETGLGDAEDDLNLLHEVLEILCQLPKGSWPWPWQRLEWLCRTSIWVSGFGELRDFTPQEDAILLALNNLSAQVTITLAADQIPFDSQAVDNGPDFFLPGRKTAWRLQQTMPALSITRIPEQLEGFPAQIAASLREGKYCPPEPDIAPGTSRRTYLNLIRANGRDGELFFIAGEIRRLVQQEGYRYQDITLAVCNPGDYTPRLRAVFREYGIPLFLDARRPLSGTPLLRFLLGLLDIGLYNWSLKSIMACLRSGLTTISTTETDRLENEMLARGISRPDRIFDDDRYTEKDLLAIRDKAFLPLRTVLADLQGAQTGTGKCRILREFFRIYGLPERLEARSGSLAATGEMDVAVALVQSWNELNHIIDQMMKLGGEAAMSLQTFRETLAAGMDAAGSIVIPSAIDQVNVGDLKRAMLRQPRILFLIGALAADLPPSLPPEGLLKDQERQTLSSLLNRQLPSSARDQSFADAFVIYTLLTLPTDQLYLTCPENDVSIWFKWLDQPLKSIVRILPDRPDPQDPRLNALRPAFGYLLGFCSNRQKSSADEPALKNWQLIASVLQDAGMPLAPAAHWLRQSVTGQASPDTRIGRDLMQALYPSPVTMSVSQLEKYASCPFYYLTSYLLTLQERPVWTPEAAQTGTLLHGIVELALQELHREFISLKFKDSAEIQNVLQRWLQSDLASRTLDWMMAAARREKLEMFFENGLKASAGFRVWRLATASIQAILRQYQQEQYLPSDLEWCFGPKEAFGLCLHLLDGTAVAFRGKVDRIDLESGEPGKHFRIVDYKSSNKKADFDTLYHGLSLQLPIYLEAYKLANPGYVADDAAYFHFNRPILTLASGSKPSLEQIRSDLDRQYALQGLRLEPDQLSALCRHALNQAERLAQNLLDGNFTVAPRKLPGKPPACEYCTMQAICGFDGRQEHFFRLQPLKGRQKDDGKFMKKRDELILRFQEQEALGGGADFAAHT